jgi:hypothetical protein
MSVPPEFLSQLIAAHAATLELYARQICDTPEDAVQDAFVKRERIHLCSSDRRGMSKLASLVTRRFAGAVVLERISSGWARRL